MVMTMVLTMVLMMVMVITMVLMVAALMTLKSGGKTQKAGARPGKRRSTTTQTP